MTYPVTIDPARLYPTLQNTGLQNKDPKLYQLLYFLIGNVLKLGQDTTGTTPGGGSGTTVINQQIIQQFVDLDGGGGGSGEDGPPGQAGARGADGVIGRDGATLYLVEAPDDDPMVIPGPAGSTGTTGATGAAGPVGPILYLVESPDDDPWVIPGPRGDQGVAGIPGALGPVFFPHDGETSEPFVVPGKDGNAGALIYITEKTASAQATVDFANVITSQFDEYVVELLNVIPATNGSGIYMRMSTNGGSTYDSGTNYKFASQYVNEAGTTNTSSGTTQTMAFIGGGVSNTTAGGGLNGYIKLYTPLSAVASKHYIGDNAFLASDAHNYKIHGGGWYVSNTAVNAFQFLTNSGNITSGTFRVYGVSKVGGPTGIGDVIGPTVSVDTEVVIFDGTSGKAIKATGTGAAILSGGQLTFPATQNSSSGANTLDDYEEGTWTPVDSSGAGLTLTLTANNQTYIKIGRLVVASFRITYPATADGSANLIGGLPFAATNTTNSIYGGFLSNSSLGVLPMMNVTSNATTLFFRNPATGGQYTNANLTGATLQGDAVYLSAV